jgi:hypothetical protein
MRRAYPAEGRVGVDDAVDARVLEKGSRDCGRLGCSPLGGHRIAWPAGNTGVDAILELSDCGRLDRPHVLELEVGADAVEEPRAATEDARRGIQ